jgi:hypothetical protein
LRDLDPSMPGKMISKGELFIDQEIEMVRGVISFHILPVFTDSWTFL